MEAAVGARRSISAICLLTAIGLFWMSLYLYVPTLSPFIVHQGGSLLVVGLVVAAYGVPQLVCRVALGVWSDRLGRRKPFLLAGFGLAILSGLAMAEWPLPLAFIGWRLLAGAAASMWAMFSVLYVSYFPGTQAVKALGWVSFAAAGGQVVASLLGGSLAERWGWTAPFWGATAVAVLGLVLMIGVKEVPTAANHDDAKLAAVWWLLRRYSSLRLASGLGICFQVGNFVATFGYVPVLAYRMGLSRGNLGLLLMVSLIPTTLAAVVTGSVFSHWWSVRQMAIIGFFVTAAMAAVTPWVGSVGWLFVTQALLGFGRGMLSPALMSMAIREVDAPYRVTAMASYQALYSVGMIAGPALAGWIIGIWGLPSAFGLAGAASLTGGLLAWFSRQRAWILAGSSRGV